VLDGRTRISLGITHLSIAIGFSNAQLSTGIALLLAGRDPAVFEPREYVTRAAP
jgi:hypothetical protein